jgi:hypothetical protein
MITKGDHLHLFSPRLASILVLRAEPVVLGQAAIALFADHPWLAGALSGHFVAALVAQRSNQIALAGPASVRVLALHVPEAVAATVTAPIKL